MLMHLSDEEGLDGDVLYPQLPDGTTVWRNFSYPRFDKQQRVLIRNFPIGPRREFLECGSWPLASQRSFPWAFMGTLWIRQRLLATSLAQVAPGAVSGPSFRCGSSLGAVPPTPAKQCVCPVPEGIATSIPSVSTKACRWAVCAGGGASAAGANAAGS